MTPAEWAGLALVTILAGGSLGVLFVGAVRFVLILEADERYRKERLKAERLAFSGAISIARR